MGMFNMVYIFNFCNYEKLSCAGKPVSVYETLEVMGTLTDNCDIISKSFTPIYSHINNDVNQGLELSYTNGDICFSPPPPTFGPNKGS